jgi:diguanylate cyclase (GGDEF)-like protein
MSKMEIVLDWHSALEKEGTVKDLQSHGFDVVDGTNPTLRVMDTALFYNVKSAMADYFQKAVPTVVIVADTAQESAVLPQLRIGDDLCLRDNAEVQLVHRLIRVAARSEQFSIRESDTPMFLDPLTGLQNRHAFFLSYYDTVRDAGPDSPYSLMLIDLDGFKEINDRFGHSAGDAVLSSVGEILRRVCRGAAGICRFGGDEFLVASKVGREQIYAMAEFLVREIGGTSFLEGQAEQMVTVSIGAATSFGEHSGDELMQEVDRNMYAAKKQGKNRVVASESFLLEAEKAGEDPQVVDFENRVRVLTEKLVEGLMYRGKSLARHYKEEADHDGLTGLYIRRYFDRRFSRDFEKARSAGRPLALLFLDIDHFGQVNKTYGFPTGDKALRFVAGVLKDSMRVVDWVARYGGEELCAVMPDTTLQEAVAVAERVRRRIEDGRVSAYDGRIVSLTASLGAGVLVPEDADIVDFVQRVGDKTREAKASGRNAVCY